jgi:hypothetical protein
MKILYWLFGKKAYSINSSGRVWRGKYKVFTGSINIGDVIWYGEEDAE